MANYLVTDTDLTSVANAIRAKSGATGGLTFPLAFVNTIAGIETGDGCNATASDILNGKTAVVNKQVVTGNIPTKAAETFNTSSSDQLIAAGKYLTGDQTIKAVTTANISASNIKKGVTIKVGDANDDDRIATATGTFIGEVDYAKTVRDGTATFNSGVAVYHDTITFTRTVTGSYFFFDKAEILSSDGASGITSVFFASPTDNMLSITIQRGNTAGAGQCTFRVEVYEVYPKQSY